VRPLLLSVEGLTAFADLTVVDFRELQLFAITGTTGAGKSTLIDAMLLALYGKVPRTGSQHGQLIAHGKDQINVLLEFEARGERYRVARTIRRVGAGKVHLERVTDAGPQPIAGKARDVEAEIERILGIDYEAFTHAVVLPQGQFDEFLRGDPKQRRAILVNLLGLLLYERMGKLCGERQREGQARVEALGQRLREDFAHATAEHRDALQRELDTATQELAQLDERAAALAALLQLAVAAEAARKHQAARQAARGALLRQQQEAKAELERLQAGAGNFDGERQRLEAAIAGAAIDPARGAVLALVQAQLPLLLRALADRPQLQRDAASSKARAAQLAAELAAAQAQLPALHDAVQAQRDECSAAEAELEAEQRAHAAAHLRAALARGAPCPVCAQPVGTVPPPLPVPADDARARVATARQLLQGAEHKRAEAERTQRERQEQWPSGKEHERTAAERLRRADADVAQAVAELAKAGIELPAPVTAGAVGERQQAVQQELQALQSGAQRRGALQKQLDALLLQHRDAAATFAKAGERAELLSQQLAQLDAEIATATADATAAERALATAATAAAVDAKGLDAVARLQRLQKEHAAAQQQQSQRIGQLRAQIDAVTKSMAQADKLRAEHAAATTAAALAKSLALLLRGDRFLDYVLEAALQRLCQDGSERMLMLSGGRYSLRHDGADFAVVDHWNADRERSVRTLSGGETFLASLALALALATGIRAFAAADGSNSALDCLFVDEGFGALDGEALEAAVQALESLQGQSRMVGVVTHLQALAERLPARLHVENNAGRARVVAS